MSKNTAKSKKGSSPTFGQGGLAMQLWEAVRSNHFDNAMMLLNLGADVNAAHLVKIQFPTFFLFFKKNAEWGLGSSYRLPMWFSGVCSSSFGGWSGHGSFK